MNLRRSLLDGVVASDEDEEPEVEIGESREEFDYDESKHPRDEHGRFMGGETTDEVPRYKEPEQKKQKHPNLVGQLLISSAATYQRGNAQHLIDYFNEGADGQIDWGTHGDFEQCVTIASKHMDEDQARGFCQERHMDATGEPAGKGAHKASAQVATLRTTLVNGVPAVPGVVVAAGNPPRVTYGHFARTYARFLDNRDAIEIDLQGHIGKVFATQGRIVHHRLVAIRRHLAAGKIPLIAAGHPHRKNLPNPQVEHPIAKLRASEVFMDGFDDEMDDELDEPLRQHSALIGGALVGVGLYGTARALNNLAQQHVDQTREIATASGRRAIGGVEGILSDTYANGGNYDNVIESVGAYFDRLAGMYGASMARSMTTGLLAGTSTIAARLADVPVKRMWLSQRDDRVRGLKPGDPFDHDEADGQIVDLDEPFVVSGEELDYPGDPTSSLGNWINCRCVAIHVPEDYSEEDAVADEGEFAAGTESFDYDPEKHPKGPDGRWIGTGEEVGTHLTELPSIGKVDEFLAANPRKEGEKLFEYQSRIVQNLSPDLRHSLLFQIRETYPAVPYISQGAHDWREAHGLPDPQANIVTIPAPLAKAEIVARDFENIPDQSNDPKVQAAYEDFKRQNGEMWDYMTKPASEGGMGVKVDFSPNEKGDPYPSAAAQAQDLRDNHHITIQSGLGGEHTLMSTEEYDRFRAVHDTFGHAGTGAGFDRHGEYETYLEHRTMYTGEGAKAMASEYHASNTAIWAGKPGTPGTGKAIILPDNLIPDPWDEHGHYVRVAARDRVTFAVQDAQTGRALGRLANKLHLNDQFAADFDRLGWHYEQEQVTASGEFAADFDPEKHPRDEKGQWTGAQEAEKEANIAAEGGLVTQLLRGPEAAATSLADWIGEGMRPALEAIQEREHTEEVAAKLQQSTRDLLDMHAPPKEPVERRDVRSIGERIRGVLLDHPPDIIHLMEHLGPYLGADGALLADGFDESKHPRVPAGSPDGGRFAGAESGPESEAHPIREALLKGLGDLGGVLVPETRPPVVPSKEKTQEATAHNSETHPIREALLKGLGDLGGVLVPETRAPEMATRAPDEHHRPVSDALDRAHTESKTETHPIREALLKGLADIGGVVAPETRAPEVALIRHRYRILLDALAAAGGFDEDKHPRDAHGRWIDMVGDESVAPHDGRWHEGETRRGAEGPHVAEQPRSPKEHQQHGRLVEALKRVLGGPRLLPANVYETLIEVFARGLEEGRLTFADFDEAKHPRGGDPANPGRFSPAGEGGTGEQAGAMGHALYATGTGTKDDPIKTNDPTTAARALGQNKYVELDQPRTVSTMLDRIQQFVKDQQAAGNPERTYNLCNATVAGTNLFCVESKGIPRVEMPQLSGVPVPGSKAEEMVKSGELKANDRGEVDLGPGFVDYMKNEEGIGTHDETVAAEDLRASQNELNGRNVAGLVDAIEGGTYKPLSIFATQDDYIVDGHHRWAAIVAENAGEGTHLTMPVKVVEAPILDVLKHAVDYTTAMGVPPKAAAAALVEKKKS